MPSTISVTVCSVACWRSGLDSPSRARQPAAADIPIHANSCRLVSGVFTIASQRRLRLWIPKTAPVDSELGELTRDDRTLCRRAHMLIDVKDPAIDANVEGPSRRERLILIGDTIGGRDLFARIAQERIVDAERSRKRSVRLRRINAHREVGHVERSDFVATLTE
jgi:hypothetical protein